MENPRAIKTLIDAVFVGLAFAKMSSRIEALCIASETISLDKRKPLKIESIE
jgi:hypothetical protein